MSVKGGPDIVTDGLVFNLDAAGAVSDRAYPINGLPVEYLIVAGGGGGGGSPHGAGGGAGGLLHGYTKASLSTGTYTITVGGGGAGKVGKKTAPWPSPGTNYGANGGNSTAFGKTALGGGGGGGYSGGGGNDTVGKNGGSGGGTGRDPSSVGQATQPSSSDGGFGNNGGRGGYSFGSGTGRNQAGGGGGAGARGDLKDSYIETQVSRGGIGRYYGYTFGRSLGDDGWFAGGGGGSFISSTANQNLEATASLGGGGRGAHGNSSASLSNPVDGMANTGGGGGGSERHVSGDGIGGDGGSGVVIIKYKGPQKATGGDSIITRRGYTIHVFTSSGTFTVGGRIADLSTSKIVGTLNNMGSSNYSNGNRGYFSFATNEYISLSQAISGEHRTISMWVYVPQTLFGNSTGGQGPIISEATGRTIWLGNFASATIDEVLQIYDGARFTFSKGPVNAGWRNLTFRWNGSYYDIFIDAIQKTSFIGSTPAGGHCVLFSNNFSEIGARTNNNQYFSGDIASIKVYNISLTDKQILDNYNATKGRFGL